MRQHPGFWIVVPARGFGSGKTRLAPILDADERRAASRRWFIHVVRIARRVAGAHRTLVVSASGEVLGLARRLGVRALGERVSGLNASAHQGASFARRRGAAGMVVLHADLPRLGRAELARLVLALVRHPGVALAPDRAREGTNALGLRAARAFRYRFGRDSFRRHRAECRSRRLRARVLELPGIAGDVDTPEQYRALVEASFVSGAALDVAGAA
jgi:2-phospho-L-lactate guanylyltransferase